MNDSTIASATTSAAATDPGFHVPTWMHLLSGWIHRNPGLWVRLGNLETRAVADVIADVPVDRPIYVAGLARSGTTVLLEQLAAHPQVASHRYIDYPPVLTPYWWNRWLEMLPRATETAQERAHKDGISITSQSPEAFEEVLWMAFFPETHDPERSAVMGRQHANPGFERFYQEHLRKLLAVRQRQRYVAKGNYNLVRLAYLHRVFPGARFVLAIRDPVWHIASLIKQHSLFVTGERTEPRALEHMRRVGHYEFGLDRRAINAGDTGLTRQITHLWNSGREVEGWAHYWAAIYRHIAELLESDAALRQACLVVRYEELCGSPQTSLARVFEHSALPLSSEQLESAAAGLHAPGYYRPAFSDEELETIHIITAPVAARFGYADQAASSG